MYLGRLADSVRRLERGMGLARATGQSHLITYLLIAQSVTYGMLGRFTDASGCLADALEVAVLTDSAELHAMVLGYQCWIATYTSDLDVALRTGEAALAVGGPDQDWFGSVAGGMLAQARLHAGDPQGAIDLLLEAGGGPELPLMDPPSQPNWYSVLTTASVRLGDSGQAARWAERAGEVAAELGMPLRTGFANLARSHAALAADPADPADAADALRWALAAVAITTRGSLPGQCWERSVHWRFCGLSDTCGTCCSGRRVAPRRSRRSCSVPVSRSPSWV